MYSNPKIVVIIPAHNEEGSIGKVVKAIPKDWVSTVFVCSYNSQKKMFFRKKSYS